MDRAHLSGSRDRAAWRRIPPILLLAIAALLVLVTAGAMFLATHTRAALLELSGHREEEAIRHATDLIEMGVRFADSSWPMERLAALQDTAEIGFACLLDQDLEVLWTIPGDLDTSSLPLAGILAGEVTESPQLVYRCGTLEDPDEPQTVLGYFVIGWSTTAQESTILRLLVITFVLCAVLLLPIVALLLLNHRLQQSRSDKEQAEQASSFMRHLLSALPDPVMVISRDGKVISANPAAHELLGYQNGTLLDRVFTDIDTDSSDDETEVATSRIIRREAIWKDRGGTALPVLVGIAPLDRREGTVVCSAIDLRQRRQMEQELAQARKLESIGTLAAGIAHEINTPIQFIGDNLRFLGDSFADINGVFTAARQAVEALETAPDQASEVAAQLRQAMDAADVEYLAEEVPTALKQSLDGTAQVAKIVRAMKEFSHPGQAGGGKRPVNLNECLNTTAVVARNEYKYVADLELELDPHLAMVEADDSALNQVFLNMIVNAAHAIQARLDQEEQGRGAGKGLIRVVTSGDAEQEEVRISISDNGCGIPEENRRRIFDAFFTTKEVGRGTGQGLSMAWDIVVNKHGGRIELESTVGEGSTFHLYLPMTAAPVEQVRPDGCRMGRSAP